MVRAKTWAASPQWEQMTQTPFVGGPFGNEPHIGCSIQYNALWQDGLNGSTFFAFWVSSQLFSLLQVRLATSKSSDWRAGRRIFPCQCERTATNVARVRTRVGCRRALPDAVARSARIKRDHRLFDPRHLQSDVRWLCGVSDGSRFLLLCRQGTVLRDT